MARSGDSRTPIVAAIADSSERRVAHRGEVDEPDAVREPVADAARDASASRVLPLPPGPVRVTIRLVAELVAERLDLRRPGRRAR